MRNLTIFLVFILIVGNSVAQYSNVWPAQLFPRQGAIQSQNIVDSINERKIAANVGGAPAIQNLFRNQRFDLANHKIILKNIINAKTYIMSDELSAPGGIYTTNKFVTRWADEFLWTISNICVDAGLPTNYLDFTPSRSLNGVGAGTDDTTTPFFHGFTNSFTADGGSNFPGSRTKWYTTDYGRPGMRDILDRLVWTHENTGFRRISPFSSLSFVNSNYAAVKADVIADYQAGIRPPAFITGQSASHIHNPPESATAQSQSDEVGAAISGIASNFEHTVDFYGFTDSAIKIGPLGVNVNIFDDFGFGLTLSNQTRYASVVGFATSVTSSPAIGGLVTSPAFGADPGPFPFDENIRGFLFIANGIDSVIKWDQTPDGFKFVAD